MFNTKLNLLLILSAFNMVTGANNDQPVQLPVNSPLVSLKSDMLTRVGKYLIETPDHQIGFEMDEHNGYVQYSCFSFKGERYHSVSRFREQTYYLTSTDGRLQIQLHPEDGEALLSGNESCAQHYMNAKILTPLQALLSDGIQEKIVKLIVITTHPKTNTILQNELVNDLWAYLHANDSLDYLRKTADYSNVEITGTHRNNDLVMRIGDIELQFTRHTNSSYTVQITSGGVIISLDMTQQTPCYDPGGLVMPRFQDLSPRV